MISDSNLKKDQTVFISGLPYEATEAQIQEFFSDCGEITEIKLPRYQDTGRLRGYGHITFTTKEGREEALKLSKGEIGGRYIDIKPAKGENAKQVAQKYTDAAPTKTIFVKNLPYDITEDEVGDAFRHCGEIENVRFAYHPFNKHFKGFGYIDFKIEEATKSALKMNGKEVKGRKILVDLEFSQAKGGYKHKVDEEGNSKYNQEAKQILNKVIKKKKRAEKTTVQLEQKKLDKINQSRSEAKSQLF